MLEVTERLASLKDDNSSLSFNMARFSSCGTSCCIAGLALYMYDDPMFHKAGTIQGYQNAIQFARRARDLLDLTTEEAAQLFYGNAKETDPQRGVCEMMKVMDGKTPWAADMTPGRQAIVENAVQIMKKHDMIDARSQGKIA